MHYFSDREQSLTCKIAEYYSFQSKKTTLKKNKKKEEEKTDEHCNIIYALLGGEFFFLSFSLYVHCTMSSIYPVASILPVSPVLL